MATVGQSLGTLTVTRNGTQIFTRQVTDLNVGTALEVFDSAPIVGENNYVVTFTAPTGFSFIGLTGASPGPFNTFVKMLALCGLNQK